MSLLSHACLLLLAAASGLRAGQTATTFHVGSSLTSWSNIPKELTHLAAAEDTRLTAGFQLCDGQTLRYHWNNGLDGTGFNGQPSRIALEQGDWQNLIIQPHTREWQAGNMQEFIDYAGRFYSLADARDTRVYLYCYWCYADEPLSTQTAINDSFERVRAAISATGRHQAIIIPAGEAFRAVSTELGSGVFTGLSRLSLYQDERHPSDLGAYVSALTHYATVFHRSPVGLPPIGIKADHSGKRVIFDPAMARRLQEIVWSVVRNFPNSGVGRNGQILEPSPFAPHGPLNPPAMPDSNRVTFQEPKLLRASRRRDRSLRPGQRPDPGQRKLGSTAIKATAAVFTLANPTALRTGRARSLPQARTARW